MSVELPRLYRAYCELPEFSSRLELAAIQERIGERYLALVFQADSKDVGFKLGYALNDQEFYSWLGGVLPDYRGRGIAQGLLDAQESWARDQGFRAVRVKSMNRYPAMLRLLVRNGYLIDAVSADKNPRNSKIHFVKLLTE